MTHPVVPPGALLKKWEDQWFDEQENADVLLIQAFQAGADQELEACCGLLVQQGFDLVDYLHAARRPKPPSLKEQALDELHISFNRGYLKKEAADTIRRALKQLDD
jgi:hypothetical protein